MGTSLTVLYDRVKRAIRRMIYSFRDYDAHMLLIRWQVWAERNAIGR